MFTPSSPLSGSFVVVRDDSDGLYRRGMVTKSSGRSYEVSLNGETIVQVPSFYHLIFILSSALTT